MTFAQTLLCFSVKSVWVFPYQYGLCLQDGQLSGELKICPVLPCCLTFFWLLGGICHNLKWKVSLLIDLFSQSLISPCLSFVPFCLLAIRSLILDWTPLFLPMSLVILDATELHPLQMIEKTFHQRCLKRVETHRYKHIIEAIPQQGPNSQADLYFWSLPPFFSFLDLNWASLMLRFLMDQTPEF